MVLIVAGLLTGCSAMPEMPSLGDSGSLSRSTADQGALPPVAAPAARAADPIAAFLAGEAPGAGPTRVLRRYFAASGRECQEVLLGRGIEERSTVYCDQGGAWVPARPLLRGGTARP